MTIRQLSILALSTSAVLGGVLALAQEPQPSRADQIVRYRQSAMYLIGANFGQMAGVVTGKLPYDAADFATRADRVAYLAAMATEGFAPESKGGSPSKAKANIWSNRADFDKKLKDMQDKTRALAVAAKSNDLNSIKPAFGAAGQGCKACHDEYKEK